MKEIIPISIIIPTKNEEKYLPRLLQSLKNQTVQPLEIIVADAKSEDLTVKIARDFGAKIVKGGRPAVGRNSGAKIARGDIFMFIDADIVLEDEKTLENAYKEFEERQSDVSEVY